MSLQVWLPLNGDLHNQGLSNITVTNNGATVNNNGKIGKCYYFNGSSQYLQLSKSLTNLYAGDFSWAIWLKPTDATRGIIFSEYSSTGASNVAFELLANRVIRVYWNGSPDWSTGIALTQDIWSHVAITRTGNTLKVYVNGELQATKSDATLANRTSSSYIRLGDDYRGGTSVSYMGYMNDARIYDHALSPKEVEEIAKGLVLHYKLDEPNINLVSGVLLGKTITTYHGNDYANQQWCNLSGGNGTATVIQDNTAYLGPYIYRISNNTSGNKDFAQYGGNIPFALVSGQKYTMSAYYRGQCSVLMRVWDSTNGTQLISLTQSINTGGTWIRVVKTFTATSAMTGTNNIGFLFGLSGTSNGNVDICGMKVEIGENATPWYPATIELVNANIIYDSSGYSNNGTIVGSLTAAAGSPRYDVATVFDGTNSTIKVMDNNWCSQGMEAMTINVWVKSTSWPTNVRIFSCTESGGFNTEGGNSGYYRFPINVYTNAEKTSHAYKYDGKELQISSLSTTDWIMLTFVYDLTGTKTYINGELHHTYTNTSYGIYFNMNARLFLGCEANTANPSTPYFNGQQSDFRIYTTALTADQIKELYNTSMSVDSNGNVYARELVEL